MIDLLALETSNVTLSLFVGGKRAIHNIDDS